MKNSLLKALSALTILVMLGLSGFVKAQPFVTVEQPNLSGIVWDIGSTRLISWNTNFTQPVKIDLVDYSTLTPTVTPIVASTANSTYAWYIDPLTFTTGTQYKVRVTSTINPAYTDESDNYFSLVTSLPGTSITIEQPSLPGIQIVKGTDYLISWNPVGVFSNVNIDLVDVLNSTTTSIATNVENSTYVWSVSTLLTAHNQYKIKVSSVSDPSIFDLSDNNFELLDYPAGTITVLQPDAAGIKWVRGSQYLVSWIDNIPDPVDIDLIRNTNFWIASDNTGGGSFNTGSNTGCNFNPWTVTKVNVPGGFAIGNKGNPAAAGITGMDANAYRIVAYSDPGNDGNFVHADRTFGPYATPDGFMFSFTWGFNLGSGNATTGEKGFIVYTGGIGGTALFTVVNDKNSSTIEINGSPMFSNAGLAAMTINFDYDAVAGTVRVFGTGRDGVEPYDQTFPVSGAPDAIRFFNKGQENDGTTVDDHALYFDNFFIRTKRLTVGTNVGGSTWTWTVPTCIQTGNNYKIEVLGNGRTLADASDNGFQISATHGGTYITVLQPNDPGITWLRGSSYLISWIDDVVEPVRIRLINSGGTVVATLANNVTGSTWVWNIPAGQALGQYRIRVDAAGIQDESDNLFTIADHLPGGTIEVQQPNVAGIKWIRGNSYLISWYPDGVFGPFNIELWKGGVFHANLVTNVSGSTWVWSIPALTYPTGTDYRIRVTANGGAVADMSNNDFELADTPGGTIQVLQPNGGETLYRGVGFWIAWIDDIPENVNVDLMEYDNTNTLQATHPIFGNVTGSAYPWTVPMATPTGNYFKVRVSSVVSPAIFDESDGYFTITDLPLTFGLQPNPARDFATISLNEGFSGQVQVQVSNRMNLIVLDRTFNLNDSHELRLALDGLRSGIYFVTITSNGQRMTQKLIIQK
ncbi:MAG: T9SS type A sorting domain-containing protein [Bacteroidetes bacterium]|nr:T9SS type A sorting domain-containing protein [Bacteroidota bacterium]